MVLSATGSGTDGSPERSLRKTRPPLPFAVLGLSGPNQKRRCCQRRSSALRVDRPTSTGGWRERPALALLAWDSPLAIQGNATYDLEAIF
jgi:hypothetical protein